MSRSWQNPVYWVILTLVLALIPQLATMPLHMVPITLAPLLWRGIAEWRRWKPLPTLLRLAITISALVTLVLTYGNLLGRRAAVSLLALMLALKLLETFKTRDARIVASLSLFLVATQFLFTQGMIMLPYAIGCVVASMVAFAMIARHAAFNGVQLESAKRTPAMVSSVRAELGFSAKLMLLAVPLGIVLFLFFPRWGSPLWGVPQESMDAKSGLSDSMSPGSIQGLFMDDSPAFRATFDGPTPDNAERYWRGPVFWNFDGRSWESGFYAANIRADSRPELATARYRYEVTMEPHERHSLFALDYPTMIPRGAKLSSDYQLITRRPVAQLRSYDMASNPDFIDTPELEPAMRRLALRLPEDFNPRTRALVESWREELDTDQDMVRRILGHFNQENFTYTLNPPLLSRHSVDEFMFDTRSGFCEHYASAFTVIMRMAGIPARVVTGYQGGILFEDDNYILVRQSDAHAWAEIWMPELGWIRIDPTAAVSPDRVERGALDALQGRRHLLDFAWMRDIRNTFDWVNRAWNDWVITFDATRQSGLLQFLGIDFLGTRTLIILLALFLAITAGLVTPWLLRLGARPDKDPTLRAWRMLLRRLHKAGSSVKPSMTAQEVVAVATTDLPAQREELQELADTYQILRYSGTAANAEKFARAVRSFRPRRADGTKATD